MRKGDIRKASVIVGENWSKRYQRTSAVEMKAEFANKVYPPKYVVAEEEGVRRVYGQREDTYR